MKKEEDKDRVYLLHILEAANRVFEYTAEGDEAFFDDRKTQDAVVRNLAIIGEAVRRLSHSLRRDHEDIPWKQITAMRNILIHDYFGVDLNLVYGVVQRDLPKLKQKVEELLGQDSNKEESP